MSDTNHVDRDKLLQRVCDLIACAETDFEANKSADQLLVDGVPLTECPLSKIDLSSLTTLELAQLEDVLKRIAVTTAFMKTDVCRLQMEYACFSEYLRNRQGTQSPDFDQFYKERDRLDHGLFDG